MRGPRSCTGAAPFLKKSIMEQPPKEAAWQVLDRVTAARKSLLHAGYKPIPTNGKRPFLNSWQAIEATEAEIDNWARQHPDALNTGVLTATTPAIDIDVLDAAVAEQLQCALWLMIGENGRALVRYGKRPKRAALFQTAEPFDKIATPIFVSPNGDTHRVEVLCNGQQIVAHGTHPDTGTAYAWEGGQPGAVPRDDLPYLDAQIAGNFIAKATELMRERGWIAKSDKRKSELGKANGGAARGAAGFDAVYGGREEKWAATALAELAAELANTAKGGRNERLYKAAFRMGTMTARRWIDRDTAVAELSAASRHNGYTAEHDDAPSSITRGLDDGEKVPHEDLRDIPVGGDEAWRAANTDDLAEPLPFIDMSTWDDEPVPPRSWAVHDRIPRRQPVLFSGEGAAGKSLLELQRAAAHVLGRDWIGFMPVHGPVIYFGAEDEQDEIHRRLADIAAYYRVKFRDLIDGGLHLVSFAGRDAVLASADRAGIVRSTPLFARLHKAALDIQPVSLTIDTAADVFSGNENDRSQVRQFIGILRGLTIDANTALCICSHPSLTGINSGSGLSGNTGWHNSVRARMYLTVPTTERGEELDRNLRELRFKKNNYGLLGEPITLEWRNGVYVPLNSGNAIEKAAADQHAEELFLQLLRRFNAQKRDVSSSPSRVYAPAVFATEPEARGIGTKRLTGAMSRLFAGNKIHVEKYGPPSRQRSRLLAGAAP